MGDGDLIPDRGLDLVALARLAWAGTAEVVLGRADLALDLVELALVPGRAGALGGSG